MLSTGYAGHGLVWTHAGLATDWYWRGLLARGLDCMGWADRGLI
jgi:hypothetical protein